MITRDDLTQCSYRTDHNRMVYFFCLDHYSVLNEHYIYNENKIQFPVQSVSKNIDYTFTGHLRFCLNGNNGKCTEEQEIKANSANSNDYLVYKGRQNIDGVLYPTPVHYYANFEDQQVVNVYVPVWNYYSGHQISYEVIVDPNALPEGVEVVAEVLPTFVMTKQNMKSGSDIKQVKNLDMHDKHHVLVVRDHSFDIMLQNSKRPFTLELVSSKKWKTDVSKAAAITVKNITYVVVEVEADTIKWMFVNVTNPAALDADKVIYKGNNPNGVKSSPFRIEAVDDVLIDTAADRIILYKFDGYVLGAVTMKELTPIMKDTVVLEKNGEIVDNPC